MLALQPENVFKQMAHDWYLALICDLWSTVKYSSNAWTLVMVPYHPRSEPNAMLNTPRGHVSSSSCPLTFSRTKTSGGGGTGPIELPPPPWACNNTVIPALAI
jgi:hypothetical protein